jgi:hypothetical protein
MSSHVKYNITTVVGTYQKNGEEKKKYATVGKVMQKVDENGKETGKYIFIDPLFNFAAVNRGDNDMVLCSMMTPKDNNETQSTTSNEEKE